MAADSPEIGLCAGCANARQLRSARGSSFWLCALAQRDPRFPKYPRLPVRTCSGHAPAPPGEPDHGSAPKP